MLVSTVSRSNVELTARPTSPNAFSSPTDCASSPVRALQFLEQSHVLDGNHGLVGEGFEELDLRRGEGAHLGATCDQCSNEFPLLTKGNDKKVRDPPRNPRWKIVLRADVRNVQRTCSRIQRICGSSILIPSRLRGYRTDMCPRNAHAPSKAQHHVIDPANPRGALDDGVEDRLHIRRGPADDA